VRHRRVDCVPERGEYRPDFIHSPEIFYHDQFDLDRPRGRSRMALESSQRSDDLDSRRNPLRETQTTRECRCPGRRREMSGRILDCENATETSAAVQENARDKVQAGQRPRLT
jgi:hypothetical protein